MRILFLTDNFPPEVNAPASRTFDHCREWVKMGNTVTVITCAPNFPQGKVYAGYRNKLWQTEMMEGIRVIRVWSYIVPNSGFFKRVLDHVSFGVTSVLASLFVKTDIIVATSPQFFTAISGYVASVLKWKPWVMEVRDLWPESIRAVRAIPGKEKMLDRMEQLELFLYRKASKVIVVTHAFRDDLMRRGIPGEKVEVVTNGVRLNTYRPGPKDIELLRELGLEGKTIVGYLGTHGVSHNLNFILDSIADLDPDLHFLFVGDGTQKAALLERVQREDFDNVTMLPPVYKEEIPRYISILDVSLVPLRKSDTFKGVIPSKIFENAAMGKPILLGVEGEAKGIVEKYDAGYCFEPENKADFQEKLQAITEHYPDYHDNCLRLANDYDRTQLALQMEQHLRNIVEGN